MRPKGKGLPRIITASAVLVLISCARSSPDAPPTDCSGSNLIGTWYSSGTNETVTVNTSCQYFNTTCAVRGQIITYSNSGTVTLGAITSAYAGSSGCGTPNSGRDCAYSISGPGTGATLSLSCTPEGSGTYVKQ